MYYRS